MSIVDMFVFKSRKQREKERKAYIKMMYPFGEGIQHKWEVDTISELFPKKKRQWTEYHYILLILRQDLIRANTKPKTDDDDDDDDVEVITEERAIKDWRNNHTTKAFSEEIQKIVAAMAMMENAAANAEELPTVQEILEKAETLELPAPKDNSQTWFH